MANIFCNIYLIEMLLQFLIGEINTELLKTAQVVYGELTYMNVKPNP